MPVIRSLQTTTATRIPHPLVFELGRQADRLDEQKLAADLVEQFYALGGRGQVLKQTDADHDVRFCAAERNARWT